MDRPVKEHVAHLEERVERLNKQLMESTRTRAERNRIESETLVATLALDH